MARQEGEVRRLQSDASALHAKIRSVNDTGFKV
jgi:hypothetical protein